MLEKIPTFLLCEHNVTFSKISMLNALWLCNKAPHAQTCCSAPCKCSAPQTAPAAFRITDSDSSGLLRHICNINEGFTKPQATRMSHCAGWATVLQLSHLNLSLHRFILTYFLAVRFICSSALCQFDYHQKNNTSHCFLRSLKQNQVYMQSLTCILSIYIYTISTGLIYHNIIVFFEIKNFQTRIHSFYLIHSLLVQLII